MPGPAPSSLLRPPCGKLALAAVLAAALLPGCSSGRGGQAAAPVITGAWSGTDSQGNATWAMVLPSGSFRSFNVMTFNQTTGALKVDGTSVTGSGSFLSPDGSTPFSSANAPLQIQGTAATGSLQLQINPPGGTQNLTLVPDPAYPATIKLADQAGTWQADSTTASPGWAMPLILNPDGSFSGTGLQGSISGSLSQQAGGVNLFTATLRYFPAGTSTGLDLGGLAYFRKGANGAPPSLVLAAADGAGTHQFNGIFNQVLAPGASLGSMGGIWVGSYLPSGQAGAFWFGGSVLGDGSFRLTNGNYLEIIGTFPQGGGSLGTIPVQILSPGTSAVQGTLTGQLQGATFTGTLAGPAGQGSNTQITCVLDNVTPTSFAALAGTYLGAPQDISLNRSFSFTLNADGTFSGSDAGGTLAGTMAQPSGNIATVTLTYTPTGQPPLTCTGQAQLFAEPGAVKQVALMTSVQGGNQVFSGLWNHQ